MIHVFPFVSVFGIRNIPFFDEMGNDHHSFNFQKRYQKVTVSMATAQDEVVASLKRKHDLWSLQRKQADEDVGDANLLPDEYNCPICYEVMDDHLRRPMTLFPCGHSICESCLDSYIRQSGGWKCCLCNTPFQSKAINVGLVHALEGSRRPKTSTDYVQPLKNAQARLAILLEQLKSCQLRSKTVKSNVETEKRVMTVLDDELKFVQQQHQQQKAKVSSLESEDAQLDTELVKLKTLIEPLVTEFTKLKLLAEGSQRPAGN
jgi:hypothetical protein